MNLTPEQIQRLHDEQKASQCVFVRVKDRPLLLDLAREKIQIDASIAAGRVPEMPEPARVTRKVRSTILAAAPHLAWNP